MFTRASDEDSEDGKGEEGRESLGGPKPKSHDRTQRPRPDRDHDPGP